MGENTQIKCPDGFDLGAYVATPVAKPSGAAKGAIVVIQEIFGVNQHIREVADGYAEQGYVAIAPKIFDRVEADIELGYEESDMGRGIELAFQKLDMATTLSDLQATIEFAQQHGKVGVVGYCFGGLLTWLSACTLTGVNAASSYYGGGIVGQLDKSPQVPLIMHFGELDAHIPMSDVDKIKAANPDVPVYVYAADHGFNCNHRASFDDTAAQLASKRTLEFFAEHIG